MMVPFGLRSEPIRLPRDVFMRIEDRSDCPRPLAGRLWRCDGCVFMWLPAGNQHQLVISQGARWVEADETGGVPRSWAEACADYCRRWPGSALGQEDLAGALLSPEFRLLAFARAFEVDDQDTWEDALDILRHSLRWVRGVPLPSGSLDTPAGVRYNPATDDGGRS